MRPLPNTALRLGVAPDRRLWEGRGAFSPGMGVFAIKRSKSYGVT